MNTENASKAEDEKADTLGGFTAEDITDEMVNEVNNRIGGGWAGGPHSPADIIAASANVVLDNMRIDAEDEDFEEEGFEEEDAESCGMDFHCSNVGGVSIPALATRPAKPWYEVTSDAIGATFFFFAFAVPLAIKLWAWAGPDLAKLIAQVRTALN